MCQHWDPEEHWKLIEASFAHARRCATHPHALGTERHESEHCSGVRGSEPSTPTRSGDARQRQRPQRQRL